MKLSYLAPEGSFSYDAAVELVSRFQIAAEFSPLPHVERVARSVASPQRDPVLGLVPYYNFLEGLVQEHLDLIYEFHLRIVDLLVCRFNCQPDRLILRPPPLAKYYRILKR